ncbi:MAG: HlyD family secretion protein [Oleispira sp.]|nr:HlyD family secretion protein [Oleispira sp.]MBL4882583.1 HlyD family secretion protein [Oleispira sp.]
MDLLLILTYVAITTVIFKVFKIPLNKWTVPTAALGGILLIGTLIVVMNYNHPYSETSRDYFVTTPVIPTVKGRVLEVPVSKNTLISKGDVLFKLDPAPYQYKVDALQARLDAAIIDQERAKELMKRGVGKQRDLDQATALVDQLTAELEGAKYNLTETVMLAPTDGWVTHLALRPGMMLMPMPLRPAMVFVHSEEYYYVAWFRQNSTLRLKKGYEAEVAFDAIPGKVFSGKVDQVVAVIAQGEIQARGSLLSSESERYPGRVPVVIKITDPEFIEYQKLIPGGAFGQTAIYSDHFGHVAIMRKILLRMSAWMNYLFPFH